MESRTGAMAVHLAAMEAHPGALRITLEP
jgi:hypothetical protein